MQFITTDQRIAVENFDIGLIYTVTFTSGSYFIGACIGKGADFVMFQRTAPELIFSLTMTTAADVASIDPLGNDIGKILEYTGSVPVSIKTDGSPLLDYLITGNTVQSGTPTPENPIFPQSCGELDSGQYKIPISSASTTTPVYLGEVESTRRIKKLVLTGEETWYAYSAGNVHQFYTQNMVIGGVASSSAYSTIAPYGMTVDSRIGDYGCYLVSSGNEIAFQMYGSKADFPTQTEWKSYLAQQYAAGTPVTVWYVLATPTTGIVNEPLRKIGDYADTLSYRQSGVNVPTADGLNVFDISTSVKPSEVYLKYFSPLI